MCKDCEARMELLRQAWINKNIKEFMKNAAKGAAEATGLKKKTGRRDLDEYEKRLFDFR